MQFSSSSNNVDNFKDMSPVAEKSCRLTALMESSEVDLNGKQQNRRRRLNLRRLKSLCRTSSLELTENFDVITSDYKRRKTENGVTYGVTDNYDDKIQRINGEKEEVVLSVSSKVPLDQLTKSSGGAVAGSSSSSSVNEVKKVNESIQCVTCWSHGVISLIGRRREMEDAVAIKLELLSTKGNNKHYDFFGVYDGHGGSSVAHACRNTLHRILVQVVFEDDENVINWEKAMKESFCKMDEEVNKMGAELATIGSTAVVAVVGEEEVIVANCGDSRAVISRGGVAVPISIDHKPDRPDELDRIENSGGKVINWNGQRVLGVLATSRSIGDNYLKPYVIPDPEVIVSKRSDADEFLILASDGLWDVVPNDVACEITRRCLNGQMRRCLRKADSKEQQASSEVMEESLAAQAASFLAELAIARGSEDNVSVIVVELKRPD